MRCCAVFCGVLVVWAGAAHAWGPAVHAYIASKAVPGASPKVLFGACVADWFSFENRRSPLRTEVKRLTHRKFDLLPPSPLTLGVLTHNSAWGADFYAHQHERDPQRASFPEDIMLKFGEAGNMDIDEAEDRIEPMMDYAVRTVHGPRIGQLLVEAAQAVGPEDATLLIEAFAPELSKRAPDLTLEEAKAELLGLFEGYRVFLLAYGRLLLNDDTMIRRVAVDSSILVWGLSRSVAEEQFSLALNLCTANLSKLDAIAEEIGARLRQEGAIHTPSALLSVTTGH